MTISEITSNAIEILTFAFLVAVILWFLSVCYDAVDRLIKKQGKWRPMESAPRDGRGVLLATNKRIVQFACWEPGWDESEEEGWSDMNGRMEGKPYAWYDLPDPPNRSEML